ncbi:MAG: HEAT repeat domain-containing protein [Candidatus Thorarchaeota archaeon]
MIAELILLILFFIFFLFGFWIIYRQVALVKKGEFNIKDRLQCLIYGFIFSSAVMIVIAMGFIFTVKTPEFWENSSIIPQDINPLAILLPFFICILYISFYPLIDFLFIAFSAEKNEGLTPFHIFLSKNLINVSHNKLISILIAICLYLLFIIPPFIFSILGLPFVVIWITWMLFYPLMILTFYGSKGYIAGINNIYYHIPDITRSSFLNFEDSKRGMKQFFSNPTPYILFGLMLFVFVWAWISLFQTIGFYFTGSLAISTMSSVFVFVTLFFGVIGYFTRFWGRKIKYRGIDIYFAAYLMAAIGINVLVNFLIVNSDKLFDTFDAWIITKDIVPNSILYSWAAVIEEIVMIIFTSYFLLSKKNNFTQNLKYSLITQSGQTFDPVPLFNLIKNRNFELRKQAEESLNLMFERIPLKSELSINDWRFKNLLIDGLSDPNPNSRRICLKILNRLQSDNQEKILPWIKETLESPNYDKVIPVATSLLTAKKSFIEKIPKDLIFNLLYDSEWRLKLIGFKLFSYLVKNDKNLIEKLKINNLINDPNYKIQVGLLNLFSECSIPIPINILINKLYHSNKDVRAAAIKNIKNVHSQDINEDLIKKIISFIEDPNSSVRASVFEVFAKIGNFKKFSIPISPILDGLIDSDENVRNSSILALEKFYEEEPKALNIDDIINRVDTNNADLLNSILTLLGKIWKKNPEKILTVLLIFIKFENTELKQKISSILIEKFKTYPDLIFENLIKVKDESRIISKGVISNTIIKIADEYPELTIPKLMESLNSDNEEIILNALNSLENLIERIADKIDIKILLSLLSKDFDLNIKKQNSQLISKIAKNKPLMLEPVLEELIKLIDNQELSVKIILVKSLLEISMHYPNLLPINYIMEKLSDEDSFIREASTKILGNIGSKSPSEIIDALINKSLIDEEWIVRDAAVSSLGKVIENAANKQNIIEKLILLLDDQKSWVRRSSMKLLSSIKGINQSLIPFEKLLKNLNSEDPKIREGSASLLKIYDFETIDSNFNYINSLLGDNSEDVRVAIVDTMVEIIQKIGLSKILSRLLKNLSDEGSLITQQSIALILGRTARYEEENIKKRVIALLKVRCEMSQDPIICKTLTKLKES